MASKHQKNLTARGQTAPRPGRNTKKIVILSVIAVLVAAAILSVALILILDWDEYHYIPADRKTVATCNGYKIPYEELPAVQKKLITKCRLIGKRVITATEMLETMIYNSRPTRAEISDVANAVFDGTSAVMLSGETAAGKHPVEAVKVMARITEHTEKNIDYRRLFLTSQFKIRNTLDAISHATCGMAIDIDAKAIAVCTLSGMTARMVSRFRSPVDIVGLTIDEKTFRKLALSWGVTPVMCEKYPSTEVLFYSAKQIAKRAMSLSNGDRIVITGGITNGESGNTNLIKVDEV